jgi:succinate dehydrogenase / fumarate reductase flavoprotein subunit
MCREAPKVVYELEHFGMPFDRNPDGTIYQRPFGGHTANYGEKPVQRACAAADRTGHACCTRCTSATCAPRPTSSSNGWRWT